MEQSTIADPIDITVINRLTGMPEKEKVYGGRALLLLYGNSLFSRLIRIPLLFLAAKTPFFSALYGFFQKLPFSKRKIVPFIKTYQVDASEFLKPINQFTSFNDFFIRKLKPEARPIALKKEVAIIPADGRYYFYQNIEEADGFIVKGKKFSLSTLLHNSNLASQFSGASMVMARLCPSDYHRFHFPIDCIPSSSKLINGYLYSVNPISIHQNIHIFTENKRMLCLLKNELFGDVLYLEIGATNVGSIRQTYVPHVPQEKGAEKGYFEFGASALVLLFQRDRIVFDNDLVAATQKELEIHCLMGQSMGEIK